MGIYLGAPASAHTGSEGKGEPPSGREERGAKQEGGGGYWGHFLKIPAPPSFTMETMGPHCWLSPNPSVPGGWEM